MCLFIAKRVHREDRKLEGGSSQLLVSYTKPHRPVTRDTIARWIRTVLSSAGIDTSIFKAHSTRSAAVSKAKAQFVPISDIMTTAGWSNNCTFAKYYNKSIVKNDSFESFQSSILS